MISGPKIIFSWKFPHQRIKVSRDILPRKIYPEKNFPNKLTLKLKTNLYSAIKSEDTEALEQTPEQFPQWQLSVRAHGLLVWQIRDDEDDNAKACGSVKMPLMRGSAQQGLRTARRRRHLRAAPGHAALAALSTPPLAPSLTRLHAATAYGLVLRRLLKTYSFRYFSRHKPDKD